MEHPPLLPNVEEELKKYVLCPENLPIHQYEKNQEFWPRKPNLKELLFFDSSPLSTTLKMRRDLATGEITGIHEVPIEFAGATGKNSMSLNRAPAPPSELTKGNAQYFPFWPGSFPEPKQDTSRNVSMDDELLTVPPGFRRGLVFAEDGRTLLAGSEHSGKQRIQKDATNINIREFVQIDENKTDGEKNVQKENMPRSESLPEEDEVIPPKELPVLKISAVASDSSLRETEWAVLLDASKPVEDFEQKVPEMAKRFDFELDPFQKLAILQLERHNHVFVAAHTSAGKTVVAEYAIALSQLHNTRTIYTSPIKALSNQKYRDFKMTFRDVGLITGDFQINQKASCLIMTTEILRSMLYGGRDIVRDLEYVIFDEVHYINDKERGHVWEQVLIMLPPGVCVVLLSATVPNTMEFADWLGRTHKKKVYVVTTFQRPVPLHHYLYTGKDGKTKNNRFKILEAERWIPNGYLKAKESLNPGSQKFVYQKTGPAQDKTLWTHLINHLEKNDLLPVVAFTLSRQKCDNNAANLGNLNLTTQKEKDYITRFFNKSIKCLKKPDQNIPQILKMRDILVRGVGVHHSGILPILKEIVEMLFQGGYIKLLFATETFAMGVNMPAKTVVFDSIRKHDGKETRDLEPAEYIQMAGRAGRRGLDTEGTVIILCKQDVPAEENVKKMMLGKPSLLVSQFRLTYRMVLSILRTEYLSVEGMMSRSFGEANHQKSVVQLRTELTQVEKQIEELSKDEVSNELQSLTNFYDCANDYINVRQEIMASTVFSLKIQKALVPGRVVAITQKNHINKLGLILSIIRGKQLQYKILVLSDPAPVPLPHEHPNEDLWYYMVGLTRDKLFLSSDPQSHEILTVSATEIFEISSKKLQVKADLIVGDVEKRQMERFRDAPPSQTCLEAVQQLYKLTEAANNEDASDSVDYLHFVQDLKVNEQKVYHKMKDMYDAKEKLERSLPGTRIPDFEEQFANTFTRKFLEQKKRHIEYMSSNASLSLYPDYENRIELLKRWKYVNDEDKVELKGHVACEMGTNEILLTELIVNSVLTKLNAAEVAALLSPLVYRVKLRPEEVPNFDSFSPDLRKAIKDMKQIHTDLAKEESTLGIQTDELQDDLNFGLVQIVYEWATDKPFAEIMQLTDVQEGIIVRCIQQLNEIICNVRYAANKIGEPCLQAKMDETSAAIKRDIVFAASLYTYGEE